MLGAMPWDGCVPAGLAELHSAARGGIDCIDSSCCSVLLSKKVKVTGTSCWKLNFNFSTPFPVYVASRHGSIVFRQPGRFFFPF